MPLTPIQVGARNTSAGPSLTVQASLTTPPTVGNWIVGLVWTGSAGFGADPTGWSGIDNASPPNAPLQRGFAIGQGNGVAAFAWPVVTTTAGTYIADFTVAPGTVDSDQGAQLIEVPPLDGLNLVDLLIEIDEALSYLTLFDVETDATDTDEQLVIAITAPRQFGSFNATPSPAVPPANYTTLFKVDSGAGAGYAAYRATTATGVQAIDFSGLPQDGAPPMLVISFRSGEPPANPWNTTGTGPRTDGSMSSGPMSRGPLGFSTQGIFVPSAGLGKVWNGSSWEAKPVKHWNGSAWAQKPAKHWSGSAWQ